MENKYIVHNSVVKEELLEEFSSREEWNKNFDFMAYMELNCPSLDGILSVAHTFAPRFIEYKDYIFVEDFMNRYGGRETSIAEKVGSLEKRFGSDRKSIEQMVNSWSIADFFVNSHDESFSDEKLIDAFAETLRYFWQRRVVELFPDKEIVVELGEEIMGEYGLTITVYQK